MESCHGWRRGWGLFYSGEVKGKSVGSGGVVFTCMKRIRMRIWWVAINRSCRLALNLSASMEVVASKAIAKSRKLSDMEVTSSSRCVARWHLPRTLTSSSYQVDLSVYVTLAQLYCSFIFLSVFFTGMTNYSSCLLVPVDMILRSIFHYFYRN